MHQPSPDLPFLPMIPICRRPNHPVAGIARKVFKDCWILLLSVVEPAELSDVKLRLPDTD